MPNLFAEFQTDSLELQDSVTSTPPVFIEAIPHKNNYAGKIYSGNFTRESLPDLYFIAVIAVIAFFAWMRIAYSKFLTSIWISSYSYQTAVKTYKDRSIIQKRFDMGVDLLYMVNTSLFIYILNRFWGVIGFDIPGNNFIPLAFLFLSLLIILRMIILRIIAFIFERTELFQGVLYHFFLYNKVIGILLIPFLLTIPYTHGLLQQILIYTGISVVVISYLFRLFRVGEYVVKNVVLIFYLILYLCTLEILPLLVILKLVISLAQV